MFPPKPQATNRRGGGTAERVIVAVKAKKVISKAALAWALTHAAHPGDCVTLLAIFSPKRTDGRRFWGFSRLKGDGDSKDPNKLPDRICQISESCSQMVLQVHDQIQVRVQIKVISATSCGAVVAEAKSYAANWVILDKKLKGELKLCLDELHCNIVVMKGSQPKVFRLNLACLNDLETPFYSTTCSPIRDVEKLHNQNMKHTTPVSSPEDPNTSCTRTSGENSLSSSDTEAPIFVVYEQNPLYDEACKGKNPLTRRYVFNNLRKRTINVSGPTESATCRNQRIFWITQNDTVDEKIPATGNCNNASEKNYASVTKELGNFALYKDNIRVRGPELKQSGDGDHVFDSSIREAVSLGKTCLTPPPLCSLCQSKAPVFGKPPKKFCYRELAEATNAFSATNFVTEGGLGFVHRGVLSNGLVIAVKQLKFARFQRDDDFCGEVRVLSCAQHKNVVLLIGFCIEGIKRLLVYEYICNSSLDFHLHGNKELILDWQTRLKIAIGTARGLRYLHEDCRVGCIIHGKLRPNNILLTHDFKPLVADFGVARFNEWEFSDRNQIFGTSGYLAPEYFSDGKITEKVDVYAFGLILLELLTGQRAHDMQYSYKHQLLDPHLASNQIQGLPYELHAMGSAASLCLQQDPDLRPSMSKVVKMLEGAYQVDYLALDMASVGCSGHMQGLNSNLQPQSKWQHSRMLSY